MSAEQPRDTDYRRSASTSPEADGASVRRQRIRGWMVRACPRSVYNRLYSGVFWDMLDLMIDDVERIEVIRGPGASAWGANAVNGVINIVTTAAANSQGGLVRADAGCSGTQTAVRYGGTAFSTPYRVFAQWTGRDESVLVPGGLADDGAGRHVLIAVARRATARDHHAARSTCRLILEPSANVISMAGSPEWQPNSRVYVR